ncbi:MAG: hypothetical protein M0Q92_04280 [Methanoregula sp.]|jgi:hypothetical protein|nr:hypothetical protein [Methanoregula sp.]
MMKDLIKWIIISAIILFCIPVVSAFTVSSVTIDPAGSLTPGDAVLVSYQIQFPASSGETFPSGSELQMSTDLVNPKWTWTLKLDGIDNPRPTDSGRMLSLGGFELSYPSSMEQSISVTLEGNAPTVEQTTDKIIVRIQEVDSNSNVVASSKVEHTVKVINTGEIKSTIAARNAELQTYRTHIDEKAAIGIDTSVAEVKYNDAKSKIDTATSTPLTQYETAISYLDTATTLIKDGETSLDKAWAEYEVLNAGTPVANADRVIAWFKGNKSTANNAELPPIISKREIAVSYISTANDQIASGQYAQARSKASEAYAKGNESYTEVLALQNEVMTGFDPIGMIGGIFKSGIVIIVVAVVAIVLIAVGVIIYRKRSRWDELG